MAFAKALASTALVLLVASGIAAVPAQASSFMVEEEGASITGGYPVSFEKEEGVPSEEEAITFKFRAGTFVPCLQASFSATMLEAEAESLTVGATLKECLAGIFTMGRCDFVFHASGALGIEGGAECEAEPIEVEPQVGCRVQIVPQEIPATISYANSGSESKREVTATFNTASLHYTQVNGSCSGGQGTYEDGKLTGIVTLRADQLEGETQQGLWVE